MQTLQADGLDLRHLLAPASAERPCGRDLEGTLELHALETAVREPDEPAIQGVEAVDSRSWREIAAQARTLLAESKDLRVAVQLARALLHIDGLPGFGAGIALVRALAETYWEALYPLPEEDDHGERLNTLRELWSPALIAQLRGTLLVSMRELGEFSVNDVLVAAGAPSARPALSQATPGHVQTALASTDPETLRHTAVIVVGARDDLRALALLVALRTGEHRPLDPALLTAAEGERATGILDALASILLARLERSDIALEPVASLDAAAFVRGSDDSHAAAPPRSREDVVRMLDQLCAYYARSEPSSPVPLLLQRAKRLATMSFVELVRDLADQGLAQLATIAGVSLAQDD